MATTLIDYALGNISNVANPNGSYKATVKGCTLVPGPGVTSMGNYPQAFRFSNGAVYCEMQDAAVNFSKFTIRMMIRVNAKVSGRQNLAESTYLPFSVYLDKDPEGGDFIVQGSVDTKVHNWSGVSTRFRKPLQINKWYEICLAYDTNTVGLFVDRQLAGVWAFPDGTVEKKPGKILVVGAWADTVKYPFQGEMAGFQWMADIPENYENLIDAARDNAAWHISFKYEDVKSQHFLGAETLAQRNDANSDCFIQEYQHGWIMFNHAVGAFEIHGAILTSYRSLAATKRRELSWLVSDEMAGKISQSRKSLFKGGAIYWSPWTPAIPVYGQMYLDYETLGEGTSPVGLPIQAAASVTGGSFQKFQHGRMYCRNGAPKAYEVHGEILNRYLKVGQYGSFLGWPVSNEGDVNKEKENKQIVTVGRCSEFEGGTIYWKSGIGAYEVHGEIGDKYDSYGGATGPLGFPRSNETDIPNHTGPGKFNLFEGGVIVWYGNAAQTFICPAFKIWFQRIETSDQDPWPKGENDIYMHLHVYRNGAEVFHVRKPNSGDYGGHNTKTIEYEIPNSFFPDHHTTEFSFRCRAWDADDDSDDDSLGDITTALNIHNAWGQRDNNGIYNRQAIKHMKITWSVKPQFDENKFTERQWNFWGVENRGTSKLTWAQYASAFRDVTGDPDTVDHVLSPLDYAFFKWVVEGIAKNGNCFGMSLEAIYALKKRSLFCNPLSRFTWEEISNEINIKQMYQVGASAIWWFVGQFLSGNTHDPKDVYNAGKNRAASGDRPIYCITQNYDFSGKPHAILPWKWGTPGPWNVEIYDPNNATGTHTFYVNSGTNTFSYNNGNVYNGSTWIGGRFHYMPWSMVNSVQRTPIWDAILLLLAGTIIIMADSGETTALTDKNGNNIDGGKITSADTAKSKFFVPVHTLNGSTGSEFFLRRGGAVNNTFIHKVKGKKSGKLEYAVKNLSSGIKVESTVAANETFDMNIRQMGTAQGSFSVKTALEKTLKIQYESSLGNVNDKIKVTLENVRSVPGQELKLLPKPGMAGMEIEGMKGTVKPKITVEFEQSGKLNRKVFSVDAAKAMRMDFSRITGAQELKVTGMDRIGGTISGIRNFRPLGG